MFNMPKKGHPMTKYNKEEIDEDKIATDVLKIMFEWDRGNFTVCPHCQVDDFTHIEGRKCVDDNIITRLVDYIRKKLSIPRDISGEEK